MRHLPWGRLLILGAAVIAQFIIELAPGRGWFTPSLLPLLLLYLSENHGAAWGVDGAFWAGLALDLLLHQPPGASSLALLLGLRASFLIMGSSAGEERVYLLAAVASAVVVSDGVFVLLASRPVGAGLPQGLLIALSRALVTTALGWLGLALGSWLSSARERGALA